MNMFVEKPSINLSSSWAVQNYELKEPEKKRARSPLKQEIKPFKLFITC